MKYTIKKGKHRAKPVKLRIYFRKDFKWTVVFNESAIYSINGNQLDINKLCGIRYLFGDYSARFGWRYNPQTPNWIDIMAYVHDNGVVTKSDREVIITSIPINDMALLHLYCNDKYYWFSCNGKTVKVPKTHSQKISVAQNLYFGGVCTAPHDITVEIQNV